MYLTYAEYIQMFGTLDEPTFTEFEFEAEAIIDWYTFNRLKDDTVIPDEVKRCVFKLIRIAHTKAGALSLGLDAEGQGTSAISGQSNDGVSITYNTLNANQAFDICDKECKEIITRYLQGTVNQLGHKILYRGIYPDE